jgi:hypothetical protein
MPSAPPGLPSLSHLMTPFAGAGNSGGVFGAGSAGTANMLTALSAGIPPTSQSNLALPQDARDTIYIEELPPDVTKRELSHIFRHVNDIVAR